MKIPFPKYEAEVVEEIEAYLDMDYQTEITDRSDPSDGLMYLFARGFAASDREGTRNPSNYARPMIQPIPDGAFSGSGVRVTPCQCDRFDRSWNCELHPPIDWDPVRRRWKRPCTGDRERCNCDPCHERRQRALRAVSRRDGARHLRAVHRPGALPGHIIAEERRLRETWASRLEALQDATLTVNLEGTFDPSVLAALQAPRTLEIESETEQGAGPLAIEVEPGDGSTPAP